VVFGRNNRVFRPFSRESSMTDDPAVEQIPERFDEGPDDLRATLPERMRVTRQDYYRACRRKMDPLGLPFETYNYAGLYREWELDKPVDTSGEIINSGDLALDGKVSNALELLDRLAGSERVEQVFARHAFR